MTFGAAAPDTTPAPDTAAVRVPGAAPVAAVPGAGPAPGPGPVTPGRYTTDAERWRAVQRRDEAADGAFYYVVRTTGIYSRPSCGARLARRENVEFHSSLEELRARHYRPCRRCHPDEPDPDRTYAEIVARACALMDTAVEPPNLDALARTAGYSRFHFHRLFKSLTGVTPHTYWTAVRARRVRARLTGARTVSDALYAAGFNSNGQFYAATPAILGMTPQSFRAGGAGEVIRTATATGRLGPVLVAAAGKGVCAVLPAGPDDAPYARLAELFPRAALRPGDARFAELVARAVARAEVPEPGRRLLPGPVPLVCHEELIRQELPGRRLREALHPPAARPA
ncbi:helix-turn-helix domain-containing protein [Streptomyces sp. LP05-1]|uniref:Helix-turn-helix domain-containing protein n=1 Tax=Streptomyces pyxinae TaxID=2970734 RepID=A0ABT2CK70_9ACTN|nr:Ada metal-binding domain-containing protein [Streptomyces sp. LP05-1]MCS0637812.1 helix-turn-helix domain-containing protein [Streptomyces sp. LP05-1]